MKTILFVENDPVVVTMYRNRLQSEGFRIETAEDGLEALKILSNSKPDLVTLDLMLPKLSGADVLRYIRADPRLKNIPVILFSNAYMTELGEDAVLASANKRLLKAYSTPTTLLQSIHELLAIARGENAGAARTNGAATATSPAIPATPTASVPALSGDRRASGEEPAAATNESGSPLERQQFLKEVRAASAILHEHCRSYVKSPASKEGQQHLIKLQEVVHRLSTNSSRTDCVRISNLLKAFHALLSEVMAKPAWASPSVLQTIAQATDCLDLVLKAEEAGIAKFSPSKVLVVDDDLVCNRVMVSSLKRTNLEPVSVQDPQAGLRLLQNHRFDAILLDVNMPEMTGFELCQQLRRLSHCKTTPVIFVTAYSNFQNRTQGVLSGGDDFITKPVSPLELALKVTIHMLKAHAQRGGAPLPPIQPPPAEITPNLQQSLAAMQINQFIAGEAGGEQAANALLPATGTATSVNPTLPPPIPTEFVTPEIQPPVASPSAVPGPAEDAGPVPPNLFLSTTETATTTGDAPAESESRSDAAEVSSAPVPEPIAANTASEANQPAAPPQLEAFFELAQPASSQHLFPTASLQNSVAEAAPATDAVLPPFTEFNSFTSPAPASAAQPTVEPPLPPETLEFLAALNPPGTDALFPTTDSQNSFIESPATPIEVAPTTSEPGIANVIADITPPPSETAAISTSFAETERPAAPEAQAPATESVNSVATSNAEAPLQSPVEPAAENVLAAQPQPTNPSTEPAMASAETAPASPEIATVPAEIVTASPQSAVEAPTSPIPVADAEKPAAPDLQPPATESLDSGVATNSSASTTPAPATETASPTVADPQVHAAASPSPAVLTPTEARVSSEATGTAEVGTTPDTSAVLASVSPNNAAPDESDRLFDRIVHSVTCMMYGELNATEMNLRLVRLALERYKVNELVRRPAAPADRQSGTGDH